MAYLKVEDILNLAIIKKNLQILGKGRMKRILLSIIALLFTASFGYCEKQEELNAQLDTSGWSQIVISGFGDPEQEILGELVKFQG